MTPIDQQVLDEVNTVGKFLVSKAPAAWETVKAVTTVDGIASEVGNIAALLFAAVAGVFTPKLVRFTLKYQGTARDSDALGACVCAVFLGAAGLVTGVVGLLGLFDVWVWAEIFRPDLYLVHEAILKVTH